MANMFAMKELGDVTFWRPASGSTDRYKAIVLTGATLTAASSASSNTATGESYSLRFRTAELTIRDVKVKFDLQGSQAALLSGKCPTQNYVDSAVSLPDNAPDKAIDSVNVAVSTVDEGAHLPPRPVLDGISVSAKLDKDGLCAAYAAFTSAKPVYKKISVQGPEYGKNLIEWELCGSIVRAVSFTVTQDRATEMLDFNTMALVRTDRTFDPYNKQISKTVTGYSFAEDKAIAACN